MTEVDMTQFAHLIEAEAKADAARRAAESEADKYERLRDDIRDQLAILMGKHDVALVDGKEVLKRTVSKQFASARFRDENPDAYEEYKVAELKYTVDTAKLREDLPEVYQRYVTTRWTNNVPLV